MGRQTDWGRREGQSGRTQMYLSQFYGPLKLLEHLITMPHRHRMYNNTVRAGNRLPAVECISYRGQNWWYTRTHAIYHMYIWILKLHQIERIKLHRTILSQEKTKQTYLEAVVAWISTSCLMRHLWSIKMLKDGRLAWGFVELFNAAIY